MKLIHVLINIFTIFAFLTIGSLMLIVSLGVLTMEDTLLQVQEIYENPWQALKIGITGAIFILVGLFFTKLLVKRTRPGDDVVLYGKWGHVTVSIAAINDLVRKTLRKFEVVKDVRVKTETENSRVKVASDISVLTGWNVQELVGRIQNELSRKLSRSLGEGIELEIDVNVVKIAEEPVELDVK